MFDIFYIHQPTKLFLHERKARSIDHARESCRTRYLWIVDGANDYSGFDWLWEPVPWQADQAHVWPSQHQANGGTWLMPRLCYTDINRDHDQIYRAHSVPRLHIQHCAGSEPAGDVCTRFISDYLGTLRRALNKVDWQYCWITADVCDYTHFDFTWHPSEWQQEMLHVFASNEQRLGDTFYLHVPSFLEKTKDLKLLEWFPDLNFVDHINVPRHPLPTIKYTTDSVVPAVWNHDFFTPLVQFYQDTPKTCYPSVCLWQPTTKVITVLSDGHTDLIVPREAKNYLKTQLYDYPYIDKTKIGHADPPCDVIFISNGEPMAEENWNNLIEMCPRAKRSDGITGREAAYKAAATLSETKWFFAVFAKTQVLDSFDFSYQPDRMQQPKHYIFHSRNPLNGLEYGSMNINLYNKQLVLDTKPGLDFTLSSPHEVVPICASISKFNTDPWITWRSAFREVLKLKQEVDAGADVEIQHRLHVWCTHAHGENAEYCLRGSKDALHYYDTVHGSSYALQKSFDWQWLQDYYFELYGQKPWLEF